jgi:hypothetical protein
MLASSTNGTTLALANGDGAALVPTTGVVPADPRKEVIVGGPWGGGASAKGLVLAGSIDRVVRQFGRRIYELMLYDSAVACAFELWKAGVISDDIQLSPALARQPGEVVSNRKRKAQLKLADTICDAAIRATCGMEESLPVVCDDMLSAFAFGASVTEQTYKWGEGQDADRLMFESLVTKPHWSWMFRVDRFMKLQSIYGWTGEGWQDVDVSKFAILTWKKKNRDPRGQSGFKAAYNPWNLKVQQYPEFGEFLHHFADPTIWITAGENAQPDVTRDSAGRVTGTRSIMQQVQDALAAIKSHTGLALPNGSSAGVLSPGSEGGAYHGAFDRFDMEIFRAILFSSRAVQEAKHGSKADTDSNVQLFGLACQQGRIPLKRCLKEQVYKRWVRLNWGAEVANTMTPDVSFGNRDSVQADMLNAYGNAFFKGFVDEAQLPVLWDKLGLPPIDEAAMKARLEQRKAKAAQGPTKGEPVQDDGNGDQNKDNQ